MNFDLNFNHSYEVDFDILKTSLQAQTKVVSKFEVEIAFKIYLMKVIFLDVDGVLCMSRSLCADYTE